MCCCEKPITRCVSAAAEISRSYKLAISVVSSASTACCGCFSRGCTKSIACSGRPKIFIARSALATSASPRPGCSVRAASKLASAASILPSALYARPWSNWLCHCAGASARARWALSRASCAWPSAKCAAPRWCWICGTRGSHCAAGSSSSRASVQRPALSARSARSSQA